MQLFPCPFCGLRDEREFVFLGPGGKVRPQTARAVSDEAWAAYLYDNPNPLGTAREVWMHRTCSEVFVMERDTQSMKVHGSRAPGKDIS